MIHATVSLGRPGREVLEKILTTGGEDLSPKTALERAILEHEQAAKELRKLLDLNCPIVRSLDGVHLYAVLETNEIPPDLRDILQEKHSPFTLEKFQEALELLTSPDKQQCAGEDILYTPMLAPSNLADAFGQIERHDARVLLVCTHPTVFVDIRKWGTGTVAFNSNSRTIREWGIQGQVWGALLVARRSFPNDEITLIGESSDGKTWFVQRLRPTVPYPPYPSRSDSVVVGS